MPRSIIPHPGQCSWLAYVATSHNQVDCKVLNPYSHMGLIEEYAVPYGGDTNSDDGERITVAKPVGDECSDDAEERGDDWDPC